MEKTREGDILTPLVRTTKAFYIFVGILIAVIAWFAYALYTQSMLGLAATGMRDVPAGVPWGLYIANAIFFEGIAASGAIILIMVYLFKWKKYRPVARIGIVMTCIFLVLAMLSIMFDLGRADRAIVNLFIYSRVSSPFVWDLAFLVNYLVLSLIAAYLMLRTSLPAFMGRVSKWRRRMYRLLVGRHIDTKMNRMFTEGIMKWISGGFLIFLILVSAAVVPFIFGMMVGRPGWYNPFFGVYFFVAAIAAGLAAIIMIAAILRFLYKWDKHIKLEIFTGLGKFVAALTLIYLFLMFSEQLTWQFMGTAAELEISREWLFGAHALVFWPTVAMLVVSVLILLTPRTRTIRGIFIASILALVAYWIKRLFIISDILLHPLLPYPMGAYTPTWVEWSIMGGTIALGILIFTLFLKVFPIMEPHAEGRVVKSG
jgi:molybdopterin-containing oxidoreductase family membrane subunit